MEKAKIKNKKRFKSKILKIIALVIITIIATEIVYNITVTDINAIKKLYNEKKEKCELLRNVVNYSIEEGIGIYVQNIPSKDIKYEIYTEKNHIIFYFYIEEELNYNAKVTLSNDYEILDEEYSTSLEKFEKFKDNYQKSYKILVLICVYVVVVILIVVLYVFRN